MSDTPKTDKEAGFYEEGGYWQSDSSGGEVDADFARELERENARLRETLGWLVKSCEDRLPKGQREKLDQEIAESRNLLSNVHHHLRKAQPKNPR